MPFLYDSTALNAFFGYAGWRFYQNANEKTAKHLFFFSLVHLPLLLMLFMIHKRRRDNSVAAESDDVRGINSHFVIHLFTMFIFG